MTTEPDDNTLDNAGTDGVAAADMLAKTIITVIGTYRPHKRREAIARIVANNLYDWIEENER